MKKVLISIQPQHVSNIITEIGKENGKPVYKKTIEVRKNRPKLETPFKCYIYETQGATETPFVDEEGHYIFKGRGAVIGEFVCDRIDEYKFDWSEFTAYGKRTYLITETLLKNTCLSREELSNYGCSENGHKETLYGWHISDLVIYDKPKALSEFSKPFVLDDRPMKDWCHNHCEICDEENCKYDVEIKRPPQSWCYVESLGE